MKQDGSQLFAISTLCVPVKKGSQHLILIIGSIRGNPVLKPITGTLENVPRIVR